MGQGAMSAVAAHIIMYNIHAIPSPAKIRVSVYPVSCQESTVTRRGVFCENAKLHARYCASSDHLRHGTSHRQTTQPCQRAPCCCVCCCLLLLPAAAGCCCWLLSSRRHARARRLTSRRDIHSDNAVVSCHKLSVETQIKHCSGDKH